MRGRRVYAAILAAFGLLLLTGAGGGAPCDLPDSLEIKKSGIEILSMPVMEAPPIPAGASEEPAGPDASQEPAAPGTSQEPAVPADPTVPAGQPAGESQGAYLGGAKLMLLANQGASQMLSSVIQTVDGSVIVVDGGTPEDAPHLIETVQSMGGRVNAWLVTHLHNDHVGALITILNMEQPPLEIDGIYYSVAGQDWYDANDPTRTQTAAAFMDAIQKFPQERRHDDISKGTQIAAGDAVITVLNRRYLLSVDSGNNASVAYMVHVGGRDILYLGDMGLNGGDLLLQDWSGEGLKCDIVQMAHHGQNGVGESFYQTVRPEICLWPTPQWLWDNDNGGGPGSGPWRTAETRWWMEKMGVTRHYCIKDGDQIIQ